MGTGAWEQEPGKIIATYLLGEQDGASVMKEMRQKNIVPSEAGKTVKEQEAVVMETASEKETEMETDKVMEEVD